MMDTIPNKGTMIYNGVKRFYHLKCLGQQNVTAEGIVPRSGAAANLLYHQLYGHTAKAIVYLITDGCHGLFTFPYLL